MTSGTPAGATNVAREGPPPNGADHHPVEGVPAGVDIPDIPAVPAVAAPDLHAPQCAPREVIPVPPGLLPIPDPPNQTRGEAQEDVAPTPMLGTPLSSRRSSVTEPAGEPGHLDSIPEEILEETPCLPEPVSKKARVEACLEEEVIPTRAPGTPVQHLFRERDDSSASASSSLTPAELLPMVGRVERQAEEWEHLVGGRGRERSPRRGEGRAPQPRDHEQLYETYLTEEWSGTFATFCNGDENLALIDGEWTFLAKRADEISLKDLSQEERKQFQESDEIEWEAMLASKAIRVLHGKAAQEVREKHPTRIISSRMVRRKKPIPGLGAWKPKSRWCLRGHHDPDSGRLVTFSPTPAGESMMAFLQTSLCLGHRRAFADVKSAFTQSLPLQREAGPIFTEPCPGLPVPQDSIIEVLVPIYGLDDAPMAWRNTVVQHLVKLGYERNVIEPCWYAKYDQHKRNVAQILIEVDDFIVSADDQHMMEVKESLTTRFKFGKWDEDSAEYAGRQVTSFLDRIEVSQEKYIVEQVHPVQLSKERKKDKKASLQKEEFEALRSLIFKLNWLGRETRPEACGLASILASRLPSANIGDILMVNKFVNHLQNTAKRPLVLWKFRPENLTFVMVSDAGGVKAHADSVDEGGLPSDTTQGAWMVLVAESLPKDDRRVRASPISWRSGKLRRKVLSTFGGETQAMLQGVAETDWLQIMFRDAIHHDVALKDWRASLCPHLVVARESITAPNKAAQCLVTDAKSLFDCILKENPSGRQDRKSALELAIILRDLQDTRSQIKWVPHQLMLVDVLTKDDPSRGNGALEHFLKTGLLSFVNPQQELERRRVDPMYKQRSHKASASRLRREDQVCSGSYATSSNINLGELLKYALGA